MTSLPEFAVLSGALAMTAPLAQAHAASATRSYGEARAARPDKSRVFFREFGKCMVRQDRPLAREFLQFQSGNYVVDDKYLRLASARCLSLNEVYIRGMTNPNALRMSPAAMRYLIAEALIASELDSFDPSVISLAAPLSHPVFDPAQFSETKYPQFDRKVLEVAKGRAIAEIALSHYGECVVRAEPSSAQKLLKSKVDSVEEVQILSAIVPALTRCVDKGQQLTTDRLVLRGTIALNYYRLAKAPHVTAPGVTH